MPPIANRQPAQRQLDLAFREGVEAGIKMATLVQGRRFCVNCRHWQARRHAERAFQVVRTEW